jgi:hypothetical protein
MGSIRHAAMLLFLCKSLRDAVTPVHSKRFRNQQELRKGTMKNEWFVTRRSSHK